MRLADVLTHDDAVAEGVEEAEDFQCFAGGGAVRGQVGVRDGELIECTGPEGCGAGGGNAVGVEAPERETSDGVGEAGSGDGQGCGFEQLGAVLIGSQQDVEWGAVADLGVQLAGGAGGYGEGVLACVLEVGCQVFGRFGEVGGDGYEGVGGGCGGGEEYPHQRSQDRQTREASFWQGKHYGFSSVTSAAREIGPDGSGDHSGPLGPWARHRVSVHFLRGGIARSTALGGRILTERF